MKQAHSQLKMSESTTHSTLDATSETMIESREPLLDESRATSTITTYPSTPCSGSSMSSDHPDRKQGKVGPWCCAITSLAVAITGAILAFTFPFLYHNILNYQLSLQSGTLQYQLWTDAPIPIHINIYLFSVTNSQDVINFKAKPILKQLGPYTFTEKHVRVNVQPHDNYTITFQQRRIWHFVPEMSNGSLNDNVTSLNVPLVGAAHFLRFYPLIFKVPFNSLVRKFKSQLFITKTVNEFLFEGYEDPFLTLALKIPMEILPPFDKFAWFYQRNNSDYFDGVFTVFTGGDQIKKFGQMDMWNFTRQTKYYESYCGMVNGSFGEGFAPQIDQSSISVYLTDICRTVTLDYVGNVTNYGVPSYRFAGTKRLFANATDNPDNWCFCSGNPSGVANFSTCRFDMPIFVSFPHYYLADPYYADQVQGLNPQKELHEFYIDLEPELAAPTSARARLQLNVLVEPNIDVDPLVNVNRAFYPLIWLEMNAGLNQDLGWFVNLALKIPVIGSAFFFALFCLSLVTVTASFVILIRRRSRVHSMASIGPCNNKNQQYQISK